MPSSILGYSRFVVDVGKVDIFRPPGAQSDRYLYMHVYIHDYISPAIYFGIMPRAMEERDVRPRWSAHIQNPLCTEPFQFNCRTTLTFSNDFFVPSRNPFSSYFQLCYALINLLLSVCSSRGRKSTTSTLSLKSLY